MTGHSAETVAQQEASGFLLGAISKREDELCQLTDRLLSEGSGSAEAYGSEIREFVISRLAGNRTLHSKDVPLARAELGKRVKGIRTLPFQLEQEGFYIAEGKWKLLGGFPETGPKHPPSDWSIWLRGLDLNQRPLGYEPNNSMTRLCLSTTYVYLALAFSTLFRGILFSICSQLVLNCLG